LTETRWTTEIQINPNHLDKLIELLEEKIEWINGIENLEGVDSDAYSLSVPEEELEKRRKEASEETVLYTQILEDLRVERTVYIQRNQGD